MRRFGLVVAIASMTLLPEMALATVYGFQDTETSGLSPVPVSFTFSLDTATAGNSGDATSFNNVAISENGVLSSGNTVDASFATNLSSPLFFFVDTALQPFYSGSGTSISFNPGTFAIADGLTDAEGTLTISAASASAVPEPATWALLFAGAAMTAALRLSRTSSKSSRGSNLSC